MTVEEQFKLQWKKNLPMLLNQVGAVITGRAKELSPVDTGRMRRSLVWRIEMPDTVVICSNVPYAKNNEYGTPKMPAGTPERPFKTRKGKFRPFVRSAIYQIKDEGQIEKLLKRYL